MKGYFLSPEFGGAGYLAFISGEWISKELRPLGNAPAVIQRPGEHQFLEAWSEKRRSELGLKSTHKPQESLEPDPEAEHGLDSVLDEVLASSKERKKDL